MSMARALPVQADCAPGSSFLSSGDDGQRTSNRQQTPLQRIWGAGAEIVPLTMQEFFEKRQRLAQKFVRTNGADLALRSGTALLEIEDRAVMPFLIFTPIIKHFIKILRSENTWTIF
jgi:hypothetical protein